MNKICTLLICLWFTVSAMAQTNISGPQDVPSSAAAINVATLGIEESTADAYFSDAEKNEHTGDLNGALSLFGKAAFEYNADKKLARYAASLMRMSNIHLTLGHYTEAEQVILNAALKTYTRLGSKTGQMASYGQLGKIYYAANKFTQSLWFYTQQGILAGQLNNKSAYIESVIGQAQIKIKKNEFSMALNDLKRAETLAKNAKITQFTNQIKISRQIIAEKQSKRSRT